MGFIWFLITLIIIAFIYIRISKKISSLNLELSEELKNEILSLITEFNHSAERNITLIEDRVNLAKNISNEIGEKLNYMQKLKESLEKEIKDSEKKLKTILNNEKAAVKKIENKKKSIITKTYETIQNLEKNKENSLFELNEPPKENKDIKKEKKQTETLNRNDQISKLSDEGLTHQQIASKLEITLGEIELVLKLAKQQRNNS